MNAKIGSAALTDPFPQRLQSLSQDPQNQALHSMLKTPTAMLIPAKIAMGITLHRTLSRDTSEQALYALPPSLRPLWLSHSIAVCRALWVSFSPLVNSQGDSGGGHDLLQERSGPLGWWLYSLRP